MTAYHIFNHFFISSLLCFSLVQLLPFAIIIPQRLKLCNFYVPFVSVFIKEIERSKKTLSEIQTEHEMFKNTEKNSYSRRQIATMLQFASGTVANGQIHLRQKSKENIERYGDLLLLSILE